MADKSHKLGEEAIQQLKTVVRGWYAEFKNDAPPDAFWQGKPARMKLAKSSTDITKGASGDVVVWNGTTPSSVSETTTTLSAYARLGDVSSGKWCYIQRMNGGWEIVNTECADAGA